MAGAEDDGFEIPDEPPGIGSAPLAISLMPFALLLILYFAFPAYGSPAFRGPPDIVGIPLGMVALFAGLAWGALGVYLVSEADNFGTALAAVLTCSFPSSAVVALAPLLSSRPVPPT